MEDHLKLLLKEARTALVNIHKGEKTLENAELLHMLAAQILVAAIAGEEDTDDRNDDWLFGTNNDDDDGGTSN